MKTPNVDMKTVKCTSSMLQMSLVSDYVMEVLKINACMKNL